MSSFWLHMVIIAGVVVLQSTVLDRISVQGIVPDIAFLMLVFTANRNGNPKASLTGFIVGLTTDLLSLAPLGFHAFIYTLIAHLFGAFKGKVFIDPLIMPVILALIATILKWLFAMLIGFFVLKPETMQLLSKGMLIEAGLSILLAPFVLGLLTITKMISLTEKTL